jgi:hypothetical protein
MGKAEARVDAAAPSPKAVLEQRIGYGYLAHSLNNDELGRVVSDLKQGQSVENVTATLDQLEAPSVDWHGSSTMSLDEAKSYLGLTQQYAALKQDKTWSLEERALYRRMSAPEYDPAPPAATAQAGSPEFVHAAESVLDQCDTDHDGDLSVQEMDQAMASGKLKGADEAALVLMRAVGGVFSDDGKGVTRTGLESFGQHGAFLGGEATLAYNDKFQELLAREATMKPAGPLTSESFDPQTARQGLAGSCVMLSAAAGLKNVGSMFADNGNGTVTVTFKDGDKEVVKDLNDCERLYHASTEDGGRWPGLLEMAMGQRLAKEAGHPEASARSWANAQSPEVVIPAFSGLPSKTAHLYDSPDETRALLERMTAGPSPVICASFQDGQSVCLDSLSRLHNGISNGHAYTVLGYDAKTDEVQLRNPYHKGGWAVRPVRADGKGDGTFSMPLDQFYSSFQELIAPDAGAGTVTSGKQ